MISNIVKNEKFLELNEKISQFYCLIWQYFTDAVIFLKKSYFFAGGASLTRDNVCVQLAFEVAESLKTNSTPD